MDVLADLLERAGARGALFSHTRAHGEWSIDFPPSPGLVVHVLIEGSAVIVTSGGAVHRLHGGDVVLIRGEDLHRLATDRDVPAESLASFSARHAASARRFVADGPGAATTFMCGAYRFGGDLLSALIAHLPRVLVVHPDPGSSLRAALELLATEMLLDVPGQQTVLDRLLDVAVIGVLRAHLAEAGAGAPGWYRALEDPAVSRALAAVHAEPARGWTVGSLARLAGLSRAAFARRFAAVVGVPPVEYVTGWRMALARERLRGTADPLVAVAREVGYGSEFAFAAAFKREHGLPPGRWRAAATAAPAPAGVSRSAPPGPSPAAPGTGPRRRSATGSTANPNGRRPRSASSSAAGSG